ncbi:MAG: hypothetical protein V3V12_09115 [Gammaproteobacteria bacterium]
MNRQALSIVFLLLAVLAPFFAQAIEFSADAYQQSPQAHPQQSRMYVGANGVRKEYVKNGVSIVEIYGLGQEKTLVLYPASRTYLEKKKATASFTHAVSTESSNLCSGMQNANCKKLNSEVVNGRNAVKWQVETKDDGKSEVAEYWIDQSRFMILRERLPDTTLVEMRFIGHEMMQNRKVEKWERLTTLPGKERFSALQWYDDQLGLFVREELPGGYLRALLNIRPGTQPGALFAIPAGYKMIEKEMEKSN